MAIARGFSRNVDPYAFADAGSLDTITRAPKPTSTPKPAGIADAIANISNQYKPVSLTPQQTSTVLDPKFTDPYYNPWLALYDPVRGNVNQSKFQAAGGGAAGMEAALGLPAGTLTGDGGTGSMVPAGGGTGGGGSTIDKEAYARAINEYLAAAEAGRTDWASMQADVASRYGGYNQRLADIAAAADARSVAAADRAAASLAAIDPQAAYQWNVTPATIGAGSGADYLRSIGASTGDVDAVRQFEQSLLNQAMGSAQQFSGAQQSALDIERAARQAAVPQMLQEAQAAASAQQMAYQLGLSESERRALEALLGGKSAEEQSIAEKILAARLAAAEAGVTL